MAGTSDEYRPTPLAAIEDSLRHLELVCTMHVSNRRGRTTDELDRWRVRSNRLQLPTERFSV